MTKLSELKERWIKDPEFREEYREADAEYAIIETLIRARNEAKLSQAELAKKIGTTQSAIARLESGSISPSLSTLRRYAAATGTRLHVELLPEADGVR
jgi:transcriptional regulator with XRE-family HTH domain